MSEEWLTAFLILSTLATVLSVLRGSVPLALINGALVVYWLVSLGVLS